MKIYLTPSDIFGGFDLEQKIEDKYKETKEYVKENFYMWTSKDGNKIHINDMTTEHIKNILKLLHKKKLSGNETGLWILSFQEELHRRKKHK